MIWGHRTLHHLLVFTLASQVVRACDTFTSLRHFETLTSHLDNTTTNSHFLLIVLFGDNSLI